NLPDQTPSAPSQRRPQRQILAARKTAREQEIGDRGGGDKQDATYSGEQQVEEISIFANGELKQQFRGNLAAGIRIGVTLCQTAGNNVQIRTCLLQRHSWLQSPQTGKCFVIAARKKIVVGAEICQGDENVAIARETN